MHKGIRPLVVIITAFLLLTLTHTNKVSAEENRGIKTVWVKSDDGEEVGTFKESHALVIGASRYTKGWPELPGVAQDVRAVSAVLSKHGFSIDIVMDPTREQLTRAFESFINRYGFNEDSRLIFYFAGHGHTVKKAYGDDMGYIVPVDAPNPNTDLIGFKGKALNMQQIEMYARNIESKHAIFLFDSCFSGSIFSLTRAVPENITDKTTKPVRQFITSGSANETVPDESIFRKQLTSALKGAGDVNEDGYVTGAELGEYLQTQVVNYSKGGQHPQYGKIRDARLDAGDFVFVLEEDIKRMEEEKEMKAFEAPTAGGIPDGVGLYLGLRSLAGDEKKYFQSFAELVDPVNPEYPDEMFTLTLGYAKKYMEYRLYYEYAEGGAFEYSNIGADVLYFPRLKRIDLINYYVGGGLFYPTVDVNGGQPVNYSGSANGSGWRVTTGAQFFLGYHIFLELQADYRQTQIEKITFPSGSVKEATLSGANVTASFGLKF